MSAVHPPGTGFVPPLAEQSKLAYYREVLSHYSRAQLEAIDRLYQLAKRHLGTGGGNTAAKLLLGLYNGQRFPFDLTDLRLFDGGNYAAAMAVIDMDARHTYTEVHVILQALHVTGRVQWEMETWAFDLGLAGAASAQGIEELGTGGVL